MTDRIDRIEVVSVVQRHQRRSWAEKARIIGEAESPGATFTSVASRHGIQASQIYTWRKRLRQKAAGAAPAGFASVQLIGDVASNAAQASLPSSRGLTGRLRTGRSAREDGGVVEVSIGGNITVRICGSVAVETLTAVFAALRGA